MLVQDLPSPRPPRRLTSSAERRQAHLFGLPRSYSGCLAYLWVVQHRRKTAPKRWKAGALKRRWRSGVFGSWALRAPRTLASRILVSSPRSSRILTARIKLSWTLSYEEAAYVTFLDAEYLKQFVEKQIKAFRSEGLIAHRLWRGARINGAR